MSLRSDVLGMVLAGGEGRRLKPLTLERAKPAVPFGGQYAFRVLVIVSDGQACGARGNAARAAAHRAYSRDVHIFPVVIARAGTPGCTNPLSLNASLTRGIGKPYLNPRLPEAIELQGNALAALPVMLVD